MKTPEILKKDFIGINGVGRDQLIHPHFEIWQSYFKDFFHFEDNIEIIVFVPCAAIKPYYNSSIHRIFNKIIEKHENIQKIVISNAGLIPYEFCDQYPFDSYDWNPLLETEPIKQEYIEIISRRVYDFFKSKEINEEIRFITYLRNDSESLKSLKAAFNKLNFNLEVIKISGKLHETADTDLLLILEENLKRLDDKLKSLK